MMHTDNEAERMQDLINKFKDRDVTVEELKTEVVGVIKILAMIQAGHNQRIKNLERQVNMQDRREGARLRQEDQKQGNTPSWREI